MIWEEAVTGKIWNDLRLQYKTAIMGYNLCKKTQEPSGRNKKRKESTSH